jgi:hypothetical protein
VVVSLPNRLPRNVSSAALAHPTNKVVQIYMTMGNIVLLVFNMVLLLNSEYTISNPEGRMERKEGMMPQLFHI